MAGSNSTWLTGLVKGVPTADEKFFALLPDNAPLKSEKDWLGLRYQTHSWHHPLAITLKHPYQFRVVFEQRFDTEDGLSG
ncbi:MAG: hypothetical protein CM1200mP40_04010 [Gammaproteobacteria bacterium]|nr:MAG: hypothetical protein CM1200mP40_04010 [Gammaproteobacteria bacterium]